MGAFRQAQRPHSFWNQNSILQSYTQMRNLTYFSLRNLYFTLLRYVSIQIVLFFAIFLLPFSLVSQNDTLSSPKTKWLSDTLFSSFDSIPKKKDSLSLVKKDSISPKEVEKKNANTPFFQGKNIQIVGISETKIVKKMQADAKSSADSLVLRAKMEEWAEERKKKGWQACSFEGFRISNNNLLVYFYEGRRFVLGSIKIKNLPENNNRKLEGGKKKRKPSLYDKRLVAKELENILKTYQNTGYPFAAFSQLKVEYEKKGKDSVIENISYQFDAGKKFTIDSLIFEGKHREKDRFLYSLIRLAPNDAYNQEAIDNIQKLLNNTPYYRNVKVPKIEFNFLGQSKIRVPLEAKRANKFDVLLGILPATNTSSTANPDQRFQWTGMLDITLVSMLRYGESLQLKYDKLTQASRKVNLKANIPYLFHLPLQLNGEGELFRQNTDFQNVQGKIGAEYGITPFLSAKFQYKTRQSSLGESYIGEVLAGTKQLQILDGNQNTYAVGFRYENLDYKFNPTKGLSATLEIGAGKTIIKKNLNLPSAIYDTLSLTRESDTRWAQQVREIDFSIKYYKKLGKRNVIHFANRTYWLDQKRIFQNDQIQLGGNKTIRGFNENQFFSNRFTYFTAEYRLLLTQNTYLFGFGDYGFLEDDATHTSYNPIGLGLGLTYDTPAGVVSFSYAVGKVGDIPFQPTRGKIHVGLVSQF